MKEQTPQAPLPATVDADAYRQVDRYLPMANLLFPWTLIPLYAFIPASGKLGWWILLGAYHCIQLAIAVKVWIACRAPKHWSIEELLSSRPLLREQRLAAEQEVRIFDLIFLSFYAMAGWVLYVVLIRSDCRPWARGNVRFGLTSICLYTFGLSLYIFTVIHDAFVRRHLGLKLAEQSSSETV